MNYSCLNILACYKAINCVMVLILNSQRPFLTTRYTFGKCGTLFATKVYRVVQFWLRRLYLVVLFISAGKKKKGGGTKFFKWGPIFSEIIGPPGPFFSEIFGPGGLFMGDQLLRDSSLA